MKCLVKKSLSVLLIITILCCAVPFTLSANAAKTEVVNFEISKIPAENGRTLNSLLNDNKPRKIIFPEKGTVKIDRVLWVGNNKTIIANNCTIVQTTDKSPVMLCQVKRTNYKNLENLVVQGGTWKTKTGNENITFRFEHANNLKFKNCKIYTHYNAHGIELIACKNVIINSCQVLAVNKHASSTSLEEAIQLDVATTRTAPSVGTKFANGAACQNIKINKCTVKGSRGICANRCVDDANKSIQMHTNIKVINSDITGTSSEALVLHNAVGYKVIGNKIVTENTRYSTPYSNGINVEIFGYSSISSKYSNTISSNKIYGAKNSIHIATNTSSKYGTTTVSGNKLYSKMGAGSTMVLSGGNKFINKNNSSYTWK